MITKAVILAGGFGTRFLPATLGVSKELFPIMDSPILFYQLKECKESGIKDVCIIINQFKSDILNFIKPNKDIVEKVKSNERDFCLDEYYEILNSLNIEFIVQKKLIGTADALLEAKKFIGKNPFIVINGDDVFTSDNKPATKQLIDAFEDNSICIVTKVPKEKMCKYGCVLRLNNKSNKIAKIIEKPKVGEAPSNLASVGRYLFTYDIFDKLNRIEMTNGEYRLPDAINLLAAENKVEFCVLDGKYYDCGNKLEFAKCFTDFMLDNKEFGKEYRKYLELVIKK